MITIILTYRNRDLNIVKKCLDSLKTQTNTNFSCVLVDYGSVANYSIKLKELIKNYGFVELLSCKTEQQLWCKSRAINIALKQLERPYCFVGDIDMMYHPECVNILHAQKAKKIATYFQVGFLDEKQSSQDKTFKDYKINFKSKAQATGMTLYPTLLLKEINGYDEFYNGWGSEDTDVHLRLKNAGYKVQFYTERILMLHQWHPKNYRSKNDVTPFHSTLEQINASYLALVESSKRIKANTNQVWGYYKETDYIALINTVEESYQITNKAGELSAFINAILLVKKDTVVKLDITNHSDYKSLKQSTKALIGKKTIAFVEMQSVNNNLLECIVSHLRNRPYQYQFNTNTNTIKLIIKL